MKPIFQQKFSVTEAFVDPFGRLKPAMLLYMAQEVAGKHCVDLAVDYDTLSQRQLFWAVIRHRVQITRLPVLGEEITVETWPMPTTRVAYPRSTIAYDAQGRELFRSISLWVLMDAGSRSMILPGKSGVLVEGILRGTELAVPGTLASRPLQHTAVRTVQYSDLDRNRHMNNTRCMEYLADLLPASFHEHHCLREFTVCYLSEAREQETISLHWQLEENGNFQLDAHRQQTSDCVGKERVFAVQGLYESVFC